MTHLGESVLTGPQACGRPRDEDDKPCPHYRGCVGPRMPLNGVHVKTLGAMSSRWKCTCPMTPTFLPD